MKKVKKVSHLILTFLLRKTSWILYLIDDHNHGIMSGGKNKNNTMQGVLRWENILEQTGSVEKQI